MDKRDLLGRLAANGDERLLLGRVWDKYEQCRRRNIPVVTGFLSPAEQELVRRLMGALDVREGWLLWGGYDTAQRRQAHFLPDWQTEPDFEAVAALRATFYEPNSLTHRDVLGSLMGLGVTRESVGDILVAEQSVDVLVTEPVRRFLLDSWDSAGRVRLKVQPIGPTELQVPEEKVKLLRDTVSSLRLDSVLSVGFSLSRSKAAEAVTSGKVQVNWADWQKPDRQVVQGDVLVLASACWRKWGIRRKREGCLSPSSATSDGTVPTADILLRIILLRMACLGHFVDIADILDILWTVYGHFSVYGFARFGRKGG